MSDSPAYTEYDLIADVDLYMKEALDLTIHSSLGKRDGDHSTGQDVYDIVDEHLKNMRFLTFATDYIESERGFIENEGWEIVVLEGNEDATLCGDGATIPISSAVAGVAVTKSQATKADLKQLRKDIERDQLIVNSRHLIGASLLLDGVVDSIQNIIQQVLSEGGIPTLPPITSEHLAHAILYKASRTHSGGIVFGSLQGLIDPDRLILVPQSSMSPPILVHIRIGKFSSKRNQSKDPQVIGSQPWGLVCKICSESFYLVNKLEEMAPFEDQPAVSEPAVGYKGEQYAGKLLSVVFEDFVHFEIKYYGNEMSNVENIVANTSAGPLVKIRPVQL